MNNCSFVEASKWEQKAMLDVVPFLESTTESVILTSLNGKMSRILQKRFGDAIVASKNGRMIGIELKAEEENKHGNLFLETWSNRKRRTVGWMYYCDADKLFYFFCKERAMYSMDMHELQSWAFDKKRIYEFPEKEQSKYTQMNDTWGRCVPIPVIRDELASFKEFRFGGEFGLLIDR